jgi:hypothetical protein
MENLLKALEILRSLFVDPDCKRPTSCEHDMLYVGQVDYDKVTAEYVRQLAKLDFYPGSDADYHYIKMELGDDFDIYDDYEKITDEQWQKLKDSGCLVDCFHSFVYGSY